MTLTIIAGKVVYSSGGLGRPVGSKEGVASVWDASLHVALTNPTYWAQVLTVTTLFPETKEVLVRKETDVFHPGGFQ